MSDAEQARRYIHERKMMQALDGDDEDTTQFRNVVTAAQKILDELGEKRAALHETGNYTEQGLAEAMKEAAAEAHSKLSNLESSIIAPRAERFKTELSKLPEPVVGSELGDMERHRLITAYLDAPGEKKAQMRADAIKNKKLATALLAEDPAVTGLSHEYRVQLRMKITDDPHQTERSSLQRKVNAAQAAKTALQGAAVSVRRATEVAE